MPHSDVAWKWCHSLKWLKYDITAWSNAKRMSVPEVDRMSHFEVARKLYLSWRGSEVLLYPKLWLESHVIGWSCSKVMSQPEQSWTLCDSLKWFESYVTAWGGSRVKSQIEIARKWCHNLKWLESYVASWSDVTAWSGSEVMSQPGVARASLIELN